MPTPLVPGVPAVEIVRIPLEVNVVLRGRGLGPLPAAPFPAARAAAATVVIVVIAPSPSPSLLPAPSSWSGIITSTIFIIITAIFLRQGVAGGAV